MGVTSDTHRQGITRIGCIENRTGRRVLGRKRDGVTPSRSKLQNKKLHNFNSSLYVRVIKRRRMRWAEHVARMGEMRNANKMFISKPEGKRKLGRLRRRCRNNITMDSRETGCALDSSGSG
jgi:hypothetical protein